MQLYPDRFVGVGQLPQSPGVSCVYHQPGIDPLFDAIDVDSILFGSEMVGAGCTRGWPPPSLGLTQLTVCHRVTSNR